MPTITKTIGTSSRDYSTITAWEADLDNTGIYASGDTAVGECYDDSAFDESVIFNGGATIGLASVRLSVASGQRHDGTAGTGARIVRTTATSVVLDWYISGSPPASTILEWLEVDRNGTNAVSIIRSSGTTAQKTIRYLLVHGLTMTANPFTEGAINNGNGKTNIIDNIIYAIKTTGASSNIYAITLAHFAGNTQNVLNNTVHNIQNNGTSGTAYGIVTHDNSTLSLRNTISTDPAGSSSGTKQCFSGTSFSNATVSHNLSSDTSAAGTGSLTSKASSSQFVSTTEGSEDLHLKTGADAINAGTDLGTTPAGVNFDIDGRDRDAEGDTWDIGADEFVSVGGGSFQAAWVRNNVVLQ